LATDVHTETRKRSAGAVVMLKQERRQTGSTREALRTSWMCRDARATDALEKHALGSWNSADEVEAARTRA
jgi:hypothetical protein